jgi:threonine/homoserine/homoserine lactone efflux protein
MDAFVFFAVAYLLAAGAPGTDTMLIVTRTIVGGRGSALQYALGIALAKTTMVSLAFYGAGALLANNPQLFWVLKAFGACFLLFMAVRLWISKPHHDAPAGETPNPSRSIGSKTAAKNSRGTATSVLGGFLVGVSNPQPLLFYSSIVPIVVAKGLDTLRDLLVLWTIVIVGFSLITVFYMSIASVAKRWLDRATNRIVLNRVMAILFAVIAAIILSR